VKSADGGRGLIDDRVDTVASGVKRAPDPVRISCVWNVETPSGPVTSPWVLPVSRP